MNWCHVVRQRWLEPFSTLRREWFELSIIKDLILSNQLGYQPGAPCKAQRLEEVTITMPTEHQIEK